MKYVWSIQIAVHDDKGGCVAFSSHHQDPLEAEPTRHDRQRLHEIETDAWNKVLKLLEQSHAKVS